MTELHLRPLVAADLPDVCQLIQRSEAFDQVPRVLELEELEEELDDDHVVHATDTRLIEIEGQLAAYAHTYHLPSETKEERCYIFGAVAPAHRSKGAGTALMEWAIYRAGEQLRSSGRDLPRFIRTEVYDYIESAIDLMQSCGMTPVRYNDELLRPLTDLPALSQADGVAIIPWPEDRDSEILVMKNQAFADHWGSTPTSEENWQQIVRGFAGRPDLSFIAVDAEDNIVAHCINHRYEADDELLGRKDGWINNLGTLREWRGRGIASALILHSLHAFAGADLTHASIGVDSENPTGAAQLYRNLGFEPRQRMITHEIKV